MAQNANSKPSRAGTLHESDAIHERGNANHDAIEIDRNTFFRLPQQITKYREYADGIQPNCLTPEQKEILDGILGNEFCDNVCHGIIAAAANRIDLLRLGAKDTAASQFLADFYASARLEDMSGEVHYNTLCDGNHAVSLQWDEETSAVILCREPWWDGDTGVFIGYDTAGRPLYAVKDFYVLIDNASVRRRVLWFEDRVERYINFGGSWEAFIYPGENDHVQNWTDTGMQDGTALGIPVIHFANAGRRASIYGKSEIGGGVLGFQDQINDLQWDISAAGRMTGYQMLAVTGTKLAVDAKGNEIPPVVGPGAVFHSENPEARYEAIPAGDITQLIGTHEMKLKSVSRMTDTPLHIITGGDWPSGEALLRSELPAVNKARRQTKKFAPAWQMVARRAIVIWNAFTKSSLNVKTAFDAVFAAPDQRDPFQLAQIVSTIAAYVSRRERLRKLDYSEADIDKILGEMDADATVMLARQTAQAAAGAAVTDATTDKAED